jgi:hypothetical protein
VGHLQEDDMDGEYGDSRANLDNQGKSSLENDRQVYNLSNNVHKYSLWNGILAR